MKPNTPEHRERIFLLELERRIDHLHTALLHQRNGIPEVRGLKALVINRMSEVREEQPCQPSAANPGA